MYNVRSGALSVLLHLSASTLVIDVAMYKDGAAAERRRAIEQTGDRISIQLF